ncbi:MAG: hypothetical protein CVU57_26925 [Deltaproteobacteria bacterium HGW-Deltaproteobacteria-15]|jgi:hypothetical protein|nr:MAG: hypothetical protein CVU57_26925 [Deltaproteobacteria bacterium HGW-Deltaproteobacteria-15]
MVDSLKSKGDGMPEIVFSPHSLYEMRRRGLTKEMVHTVVEEPGQSWQVREGRMVYQSRFRQESSEKTYLVRVLWIFGGNRLKL